MSNIFQHGIASGDPLQDRVIIWTRLSAQTNQDIQLSWAVSADPDFDSVVTSGTGLACAEDDHTVRVDVTGLKPGHRYYYRFHALGQTSPVGRTKTLPPNDVAHIRFAQASGARYNAGYFNAYARIAERANADDIDFVLHLGNYIYESADVERAGQAPSASIGRSFEPLHECKTLADYRLRYSQYHRDPDLQCMHAALPIISTVSEHEIAAGAWSGGAEDHEGRRDGPWAERLKAALRARREWLPIRLPDPAEPARIHRAIRIGRLADLYVLNSLTQRDQPAPPPRLHDPDRSALGIVQRKWLFGELEQSTAAWRLIADALILGTAWKQELPESARQALAKLKLIAPNGRSSSRSHWDGYPAERYLLMRKMRDHKLGNFVILSGNADVSMAQELRGDALHAASRVVTVECANTSITSQNFDDIMKWPPRSQSLPYEQELLNFFPDIKYLDLDNHGYSIVDVTPERVQVEWWNVDTVARRSDKEWQGAVLQIPAGTPAFRVVP